jgi:5-methylcytosine-specific restriction endonuclease McrA
MANYPEPMDIDLIKKKRKYIPVALKRDCWNKLYGNIIGCTKCPICEFNTISQNDFECSHIISENNGGLTTINNLIPLCKNCNRSMSTKNLIDYINMHYPNNKIIYDMINYITSF